MKIRSWKSSRPYDQDLHSRLTMGSHCKFAILEWNNLDHYVKEVKSERESWCHWANTLREKQTFFVLPPQNRRKWRQKLTWRLRLLRALTCWGINTINKNYGNDSTKSWRQEYNVSQSLKKNFKANKKKMKKNWNFNINFSKLWTIFHLGKTCCHQKVVNLIFTVE